MARRIPSICAKASNSTMAPISTPMQLSSAIEREIDPNHPYHDTGEFPYADFTFGMVDKIEKVDDFTVKISLKDPFAPFLANMAMHSATIVSPTAIKKYGKDFSKNPVGTGHSNSSAGARVLRSWSRRTPITGVGRPMWTK